MADTSAVTSSVGQNQFLQLMVKQLQSQDPLTPTDSGQMLAQLAQFSTLSGMEQLNSSFSQMLDLQQITQGSNLIGKQVNYKTASGGVSSGLVQSVAVNDGKITLQVNNNAVSLSQITGLTAGAV